MQAQKRDFSFLYPLILGAIAFFLVVGFAQINPLNAGWLLGRLDPTQHYLGWLFYRSGEWTFPLGLNPLFGQDLSSSIVYSDSIPLLAIPLKALDAVLPEKFHYFGLWIFACFTLQAWLAWKILGLYTQNKILRLLASGLFIFFPPLLWRINTPAGGHSALLGHFLILWAIYLILKPPTNRRAFIWSLLLSIAVLAHFYLFAIVALLWISDLANHYLIQRDLSIGQITYEVFLALSCVFFLAWQAGYFVITAALNNERGYGFYGMNLLGLIDPQGWSYLLSDQTNPSSWGEGFAYLGLGAIVAGLFALLALIKDSSQNSNSLKTFFKRHRYLGVLIFALTIFAISNHVGIGDFSFTYTLPKWILRIADVLRSSARLFWPVQYLLIIGFVVAILRNYTSKVAFAILLTCFALQAADTSNGWLKNRKQLSAHYAPDIYARALSNPFWSQAAKYYRNLTLVPSVNMAPNWQNFAIYAASHHLTTNAVHMARVDNEKQDTSNAKLNLQIETGNYDPNTLYVVENRFVISALANASQNTAIAKIDTFNIIAPEWNNCSKCPGINSSLILVRDRYASDLGQTISLSSSSPNRSYYLRNGWSWSEDWGTWSDSKSATLNFSWPKEESKSITLDFDTFVVKGKHPIQEIDVKVNGIFYKKLFLTDVYNNQLKIVFTPEMKKAKYLSIEFNMHNLARPVDLIVDRPDHRKLGIGIRSAVFR